MITAVSVTDEPTTVLAPPASGEYQFIALSNNGSAAVYVKFVPDATPLTTENGIVLQPGVTVLLDQDGTPTLQSGIVAKCASGQTTTVAVQAY